MGHSNVPGHNINYAALWHRMICVDHKIADYLADLSLVNLHEPNILRKRKFTANV